MKTILFIIPFFFWYNSFAQGEYDIPDPPDILPPVQKTVFFKWKGELTHQLTKLQELTTQFNTTCTGKQIPEDAKELINQCESLSEKVDQDGTALKKEIKEYKDELSIAEADAKYILHVKKSMVGLVRKLNWSKDEIDRFETALNKLSGDGDSLATKEEVIDTWSGIKQRGEDPDLKLKANQGGGPGLPGAGKQSTNDCAVFALANATGRPYSVVAATAIEFITKGDWRNEEEKRDPDKVFKKGGLMGGEVLMIAEAYGKVDVIKSNEFEKTLKEGRNILINVVPSNGNFNGGHEVVLTKTFKNKGETWFEMIDSNRNGPWQRLYLSSTELQTILKENGVVYRPEKGTVPKLLK